MNRALRDWIFDWCISPAAARAYRKYRLPKTQKFWSGQPVAAPRFEQVYFSACGINAETVTRHDDSRPAGLVERRASLKIPTNADGNEIQFAIAPVKRGWAGRIEIRLGTQYEQHTGLDGLRWLDLRMRVPSGADTIEITTDRAIYVTMPRAVQRQVFSGGAPRHVLVLVLDALTARMAGDSHPSMPGVPLTPNIDRFFVNGFHAPQGFASGEWTLPTTASMFTGIVPSRHRVYHPTRLTYLPEDRRLLAEILQEAGFHTIGFSTANRLTPAFMSHRGFDRFLYHWPLEGHTERDYDPAVWISEILGHLAVHRHDRTFVYAHFPDTHPVWQIPPQTRSFNLGRRGSSPGFDLAAIESQPNAGPIGRDLNMLRLHELDRLLGGLFHFIESNLSDETLVFLTSDHGTPWRHIRINRPKDEPTLVHDRIAISTRIRGPGVTRRILDGLTAPNLDLMPTLLSRVNLPPPNDIDGIDLLAADYSRSVAFSESLYAGVYEIAVTDGTSTLVEKFRMSDEPVQLLGPAFYRRVFPAGESDYAAALAERHPPLEAAAREFRERSGIREPA